jgi:aspartyl-tRNA(Asn)/glutamyl-tRNA(Gln) amidotransferase subunit A
MTPDPTGPISSTRRACAPIAATATERLEACIAAANSPAALCAFVGTSFDGARAVATLVDTSAAGGRTVPPLGGRAVSIKDLFDVQGEVTRAGSIVLAGATPARVDCLAVARLRSSGAALLGRTNMSEFAFSGVGINPHFGTPVNPATLALDPRPRIPGGSTSGGAVSVAVDAAWAALGSDTGGSIRIPAALQGLVGFKNTARLTPTEGAVPLSTTLDTTCAITRSVRDAVCIHEVLSDRRAMLVAKPLAARRLAVPSTRMLDDLDATVSVAFERTIAALRAAGASIETIALPALNDVPPSFSPPEAWAWHRHLLKAVGDRYDPRVAQRIRLGEAMSAADYIDLIHARRVWMGRMHEAMHGFDAMLSPTVPVVAPLLEPLLADDAAFFAANALLLRNPSVVNMLDGCALSLPCHATQEMPVGLMVWSQALCDDTVLDVSWQVEAALTAAAAR